MRSTGCQGAVRMKACCSSVQSKQVGLFMGSLFIYVKETLQVCHLYIQEQSRLAWWGSCVKGMIDLTPQSKAAGSAKALFRPCCTRKRLLPSSCFPQSSQLEVSHSFIPQVATQTVGAAVLNGQEINLPLLWILQVVAW